MTMRSVEKSSADDALKASFELATPRLEKLLINLAKYPKERKDYLDFKNELDKFYKIILFLKSNKHLNDNTLLSTADKYILLKQQFTLYEQADIDLKASRLRQLCEVASNNLNFSVPQNIIDEIDHRMYEEDELPF